MYYPMMLAGGFGILWIILHILGWVLAIVIIIWLIRFILGRGRHDRHMRWMEMAMGHDRSKDILRERYAKGEVTKEQYESMKKDLE